MRTIHMCLSIRGMLSKPAREFNRASKAFKDNNGKQMTPQQVRDELFNELAKGHEVLPLGECDNFDHVEGCLGHEIKEHI